MSNDKYKEEHLSSHDKRLIKLARNNPDTDYIDSLINEAESDMAKRELHGLWMDAFRREEYPEFGI